jgi:hypothetical protein
MFEKRSMPSEENEKPEPIDKIQLVNSTKFPNINDEEAIQKFFKIKASRKEADYKMDNPDQEKIITKLLVMIGEEPNGEIWILNDKGDWEYEETVPLTE